MKRAIAGMLMIWPGLAAADEVLLQTGGRLSGVIVEWTSTHLVVDVGPGRVELPIAAVRRVLPKQDPLATYRERAAVLAPDDARAWLELALWADASNLYTQAREGFERVAMLDPANAIAQEGLGRVLHANRWVMPEERYRALGYVAFEGGWVTPAEHGAALRERSLEESERRERRREAEARAREAERQAYARPTAPDSDGIPLWYGGSGGYYPGHAVTRPARPVHLPHAPSRPSVSRPTPAPRTASPTRTMSRAVPR